MKQIILALAGFLIIVSAKAQFGKIVNLAGKTEKKGLDIQARHEMAIKSQRHNWHCNRKATQGYIAYKGKDGKCYLAANFFLHQEFVGNSFSSTANSKYPVMGSQEMLCSNMN